MGTNLNNGEVVEAPPGSSRTPSGCAASPAPLPRPPPHLGMVVPAGSHVTPLPTEGQFPAGPRPIPAIRQCPPGGPLGALPWGSPERGVLVLRVKVPAAQSWAVQPSGSLLDSKAREVSERRHSRWHRPLVCGVEVRVSGVRSSNLPTTFARSWGPAGMRRAGDAFFHFSLRFWSGN